MSDETSPAAELLEHLQQNSTVAEPSGMAESDTDSVPVLTNYELETDDNGKTHTRGLLIKELRNDILGLTGGWPRRVGDKLFCQGDDHRPVYLQSPTEFAAWIAERCCIDWRRGSDCVTQEQIYASLRMHVEQYQAVETLPHFPSLPDTYYLHPELPESDGAFLEQLVDYFAPLTPTDRELIKTFILTLLWGGPPGKRPIFLFTGPDHDPQPEKKGRGVGKSALVSVLSSLVGGLMTFSAQEKFSSIVTRLLSPAAAPLRVALLDNLKTLRFSWADLEGLVTSPVISGHEMYCGEGRRPNTLTWALTLNGATLSKDMADRCVIVKLNRPAYNPHWQQEVEEYIATYRWEIISDIRNCLMPQTLE